MNTTDHGGDERIELTPTRHRFNMSLLIVVGVSLGVGTRIVHLYRLGRLSWAEFASGATIEAVLAGLVGVLITTGSIWFIAWVRKRHLSKR